MSDDILNTLKGMLGDNAEEKIQSVLSSLSGNSAPSSENEIATPSVSPSINTDTLESFSKIKEIIDDFGRANDSRSNLLLSLKPYMRSERQKSIDDAIRLLNISKFSGLFKL